MAAFLDKAPTMRHDPPKQDQPRADMPRARTVEPRKVLVTRSVLPAVSRMVEDCHHILGNQFGRFRSASQSEQFDVKMATAFNKLVTSLTTLQETQRKNTEAMRLGDLSQAELERLEAQAHALQASLPGPDDD